MVRERDVKKEWVRPLTTVQKFETNEYVAACGDSGTTYYFKCDAGDRWGDYSVYLNGKDGKPHTRDDIFWCGGYGAVRGYRTYTRCGETHKAEDNNDFFPGYIVRGYKEEDVIVWTENGTNTHCTTNLNMDSWETAKS